MEPLPTHPSDEVSIRCPGCGQRFTVGSELVGRVVECGSCDRRFRVEEDVMVRHRKFYPGEHRDPSLEHFGRVPMRSAVPPSFEPAHYAAEAPPPVAVEPTSPLRIVFGAAGVLLAFIVLMILLFGGRPGGVLDGAPLADRLMLAIFTGVLTLVLLLVANPRSRLKGGSVGGLIAVLLIAIPFVVREGATRSPDPDDIPGAPGAVTAEDQAGRPEDPHAALKEAMVYQPLERALEEYGPGGVQGGKTAVGIWLRDLRYFNREQVVDFLIRTTGAAEPGGSKAGSWLYPRDEAKGDFLLVLRDVEPGLPRIAKLCGSFGSVRQVIDDLSVIEVVVDNESFVQGDLAALQDPSSPSFYSLNKRELDSIDLGRARSAVVRLGAAEPKVYRDDIVRRLQELLAEGDTEMRMEVAKALAVWAEAGDGSVPAVRKAALELSEESGTVPRSVIAFLVQAGDHGTIPIVHELWTQDAKEWESLYGDFGPAIEGTVIESYPTLGPALRLSATRILGRVGTDKSLPLLKAEQEGAQSELAVVLGQAIAAIEKRR